MEKIIKVFILCLIVSINSYGIGELDNFFARKDIENIKLIVKKFDNHIIRNCKCTDIYEAYPKLFDSISQLRSVEELSDVIGLSNEKKEEIFKNINKKTLSKIWKIQCSKGYTGITKINYTGKYLEFLREMSKNNELLKKYYNSIELAGDISPSSVSFLREHEKELNIEDLNIRFVLAVHYLSINYIHSTKSN